MGYAAEYLTRGAFAPRIAPASRLGQRPRGICASHGQISTHVYILHIIPFLGCPPYSPPTPAEPIPTAANPSRTIQPTIFFPFTIKTFYRSNFLFTIISQPIFPAHVPRSYLSLLPSFPRHHPAANVSDPFLQAAQLSALSICAIIFLPFIQSYFLLSLKCIPQEIHKR